jgi:hypothetical protein
MVYRVLVGDNFHYMDETEHYQLGRFASLEAAVQAAQAMVDSFLASEYKPGMTAQQLLRQYISFGEDPFIIGPDQSKIAFSAWDYARRRCEELCGT